MILYALLSDSTCKVCSETIPARLHTYSNRLSYPSAWANLPCQLVVEAEFSGSCGLNFATLFSGVPCLQISNTFTTKFVLALPSAQEVLPKMG